MEPFDTCHVDCRVGVVLACKNKNTRLFFVSFRNLHRLNHRGENIHGIVIERDDLNWTGAHTDAAAAAPIRVEHRIFALIQFECAERAFLGAASARRALLHEESRIGQVSDPRMYRLARRRFFDRLDSLERSGASVARRAREVHRLANTSGRVDTSAARLKRKANEIRVGKPESRRREIVALQVLKAERTVRFGGGWRHVRSENYKVEAYLDVTAQKGIGDFEGQVALIVLPDSLDPSLREQDAGVCLHALVEVLILARRLHVAIEDISSRCRIPLAYVDRLLQRHQRGHVAAIGKMHVIVLAVAQQKSHPRRRSIVGGPVDRAFPRHLLEVDAAHDIFINTESVALMLVCRPRLPSSRENDRTDSCLRRVLLAADNHIETAGLARYRDHMGIDIYLDIRQSFERSNFRWQIERRQHLIRWP